MKISLAFRAFRELGPLKLGLFALYRVGLKSGYFRWKTPRSQPWTADHFTQTSFSHHLLDLPDPDTILGVIGPAGLSQLKTEADEIVDGLIRLFGEQPVLLNLTPPGELSHWTETKHQSDIKFIWEPARFGWAFTLGRAYHLTGDERYPEAFWRYFENFQRANPVNMGPNWESAQEVALRIIAFTFAAQIFSDSVHSTAKHQSQISQAIADHAARIPPTLIYAHAQNNNHLLSEAAGLITATLALPEHPQAKAWSKLGWKWFTRGIQTQIDVDGAYMQQSTNYHRLMLQLALWVSQLQNAACGLQSNTLAKKQINKKVLENLQSATRWLLNLCDPVSGHVPNLGPNDGAYILPLTVLPFGDCRSVLQAMSRAFLGKDVFDPGPWDEMSLWLSSSSRDSKSSGRRKPLASDSQNSTPNTLSTPHSWSYMRAAKFHDRPGHADQLHLDLWWRGLNIAQDAGTYLYNADPPWDNALTHTAVHNTVVVNARQQMTPAGRFLYLDWAQAELLSHERAVDSAWERVLASHNGYRKIGVIHQRSVTAYQDDHWMIEDQLRPTPRASHSNPCSMRLHWLLPDWEFKMQDGEDCLRIKSPYGWVDLTVKGQPPTVSVQLVRAGELLFGTGEISPTRGWVSPTYGVKLPALSFSITAVGELPMILRSEWKFPEVG